ncbi:MAG: hypothetical protein IKA82_00295 [Clostridia bacterium]|nr:hypothetical protein [Clostridia bacterium]
MSYAGRKNRFLLCIIALATVICTLLTMVHPIVAYAAESEISFDSTNVLDDLQSSKVNGKAFDMKDYPFNESKDIQVISFVEYCYSYKANLRDNYGLYVYIYNPKGLNLSTNEKQNKIQMAVSYDAEGNPNDYEKFSLEFCSKVESGDYKNLFYKFKVIDHKVNGTTFSDRVNSNARRYDVSGVELTTYGASSATEYGVCGTYVFTGFAEGYGPDANAKSTLSCNIEYLETIELSVKHTFYRSETSALGAGHQNQLDTVYFSVPKRFIDTYGKLQHIKAEWYEYKTKEILVTSNTDFYNAASPYIGVPLGNSPNEYGLYEYVEDIGYSLGIGAGKAGDMYVAQWGWNLGDGYLHVPTNVLYYMFLVDDIEEYDPYAETKTVGGIQSNDLYEYIKNYRKSYTSGRLPIKDGTISADLFESDIDDSRKMNNENGVIKKGYSYYDFDADVDLQTLQSWSSTSPSFWDNWLNFGLGAAFTGGPNEASKTVAPIQILKASDLTGTNAEIAERLLVNVNDVDAIKAEYNNAVTVNGTNDEEKVVVMFRFATSDYYSEAVDIIEPNAGFLWSDKHYEGEAYIAQESVFFDFDIIQLTFNKDGEYTVIPVVSSPIDIVNDITPPVNMPDEVDWWKIALALILVVLLLVLLAPVLPYIIQGIGWVVMLPVKAVKAIKNGKNKQPKDDYDDFDDY